MITQRRSNHEDHMAIRQPRQPRRIITETSSCCVFGRNNLMWPTMSYSNPTKSLRGISFEPN